MEWLNSFSQDIKGKLAVSALVYFCFFSYGLSTGMVGPTLPVIGMLLGSEDHTSTGLTVRSGFYSLAAAICGWLFTRFNRQLCFSFSLLLLLISFQLIPFARTLWVYLVVQSVLGCSMASIDVASNAWVIEIWPKNPNPFMQGLHFSFAIGTSLAPLIAVPFLPSKNKTMTPEELEEYHVFVPFTIASSVVLIAASSLLAVYFFKPYKQVERRTMENDSLSTSNSESSSGTVLGTRQPIESKIKVLILALTSVILCFHVGMEMNVFNYAETFAVKLGYEQTTGAFLTSAFSIAFTLSRGLDIILAMKFGPATIVYFNLSLVLIGNIVLYIFSETNPLWMAAGLVFLGLGFGGISPAIYSFIESCFAVTNKICGFFVFSSSISSIANPIIIGSWVKRYPYIFVHYGIFSCIAAIVFFIILHMTINYERRSKYKTVTLNNFNNMKNI